MVYVLYSKETGSVKTISKDNQIEIQDGLLVATSDVLMVGDEVSNQITIHEVNEDGEIVRYSGYRIAPDVRELLDELSKKDVKIANLEEQLALAQQAIDDLIFNGGALNG